MDKIEKTVKALKDLALDVNYTASSTIASTALSILNQNKINEYDLGSFLEKLSKIERNLTFIESLSAKTSRFLGEANNPQSAGSSSKKTLANWLFRLSHPSNTYGGKEMRKWLTDRKIQASYIKMYYDYEAGDYMDFSAGFLLGVGKSLTYDNIKGLYDLVGLTVNVHFMVTNYEVSLLNRLILEYKEKSNKSIELAIQSTVKLREVLKEILLSDKSVTDYRQMKAIGSFFIEIRTILFDFCMSPFLKVLDNEVLNKFEMVYLYLSKFVDSEQEEFKKAGTIWQFANSKFQKELEKKTFPLLLEYRMFEAGISAGNLLADIAQLLAGIILFLWGAGKIMVKGGKLALLKLLKLSATDKVKAMALLSAVSLDLGYLKKLQPLTMDSPVFSLVLKNDEINKISTTLINELSYAESRNVKMIDADVANSLLQEYRKPLLFESSATGGDPTYLISILGLFLMIRKRKKEEALENYRLNNIRNLFQEAFTAKLTVSLSKNVKFESFLREVARADEINIPDNLSVEEILQLIINEFVKQFEKFVESKIKKGVVFSKKGIYSNFNSFINGKFREVSKRKTFDGFVLLIDKRLDSLLLNILNRNALTLSKTRPIKVSELFEMTIGEFYKRFYPEKKMSEIYGRFVDKIKRNGGKELYDKREKLLAVINSGTSKNVDSLLKDYEALTDEINFLIQELIDKKKISITDSDKIVLRVFGKLNIDGQCGAARPDMALMSLIEGTNVFDFLHAANKDVVDPSHLTGSDFYQDFFRVVFGEIPKENEVTKDIIYTFSEKFIKNLK